MIQSTLGKYRFLINNVRNWPQYFFNKLSGQKNIYSFTLRKNNVRVEIPKGVMRVFKEFFMKDGYDIELLKPHLKKNSVIVDVGANIGLFPVFLLSFQPDLRFFAYEPLPENYKFLQKNISSNKFLSDRVRIKDVAVMGEKQTDLKLYFDKNKSNTDSSSIIKGFENNNDYISINCTTLQEIIKENGLEKIDILKLDCEGSEYNILFNTPEEIINSIPFLIIETHDLDDHENNFIAVKQFLDKLNYLYKTMPVDNKLNMIWAWKKEMS